MINEQTMAENKETHPDDREVESERKMRQRELIRKGTKMKGQLTVIFRKLHSQRMLVSHQKSTREINSSVSNFLNVFSLRGF